MITKPPVPFQAKTRNREDSAGDLPFTLQELKAAVPAACFVASTTRSLSYLFFDLTIIAGLFALAIYLDSWYFYPFFWFMQGTMFWALFVVGHDCGHGSFSKSTLLNDIVGHLCHTPILVPFHGWRISHRTHHANTGNIDSDESWHPLPESIYNALPWYGKLFRIYLPLVSFPAYLFMRSPNRKRGSHFAPSSPLFRPVDRRAILTSSACIVGMVLLLAGLIYHFGAGTMAKLYLMPYLIFSAWLSLVTFLHHTTTDIPWYRGADWNFLKGSLSMIDRDYGLINNIHHNIGTHLAHHIFLNIPHYHLRAATEAIKPLLGDLYRYSDESIFKSFLRSYRDCQFVPNKGSPAFYQAKKSRQDILP